LAGIFLSYRRDDAAHARALYDRLRSKFGKRRIFIDVLGIDPGVNFQTKIQQTINRCDIFIPVIAERWLTLEDSPGRRRLDQPNDPVRVEIREALRSRVVVLPVLIGHTRMPPEDALPEDIRALHVQNALSLSYEHFDRDIDALLAAVRRHLAEARKTRMRRRVTKLRQLLWPRRGEPRERFRWVPLAVLGVVGAAVAGWFYLSELTGRTEFAKRMLRVPRPTALGEIQLPETGRYFASPADWRDHVLYYVLPDRFSDGQESKRPLVDRAAARQSRPDWAKWMSSGNQWQGGNLRGVRSKLEYLRHLGVTTIWLGPVLKQRVNAQTYHGFAVQDFLDVDPRYGTRADLVDLVSDAHRHEMQVILTAVINHSGTNWVYPAGTPSSGPGSGGGVVIAQYTRTSYPFGFWLTRDEAPLKGAIAEPDDAVWPRELQEPEIYMRAGFGQLGETAIAGSEGLRSDFLNLRKFRMSRALPFLTRVYEYWIALTDCDGLQIDAAAQLGTQATWTFSQAIRDYAQKLGKSNFLVMAEIAADVSRQEEFLENAALGARLDLSLLRSTLKDVAQGARGYSSSLNNVPEAEAGIARERGNGLRVVTLIDDVDNIFVRGRARFGAWAVSDHQVTAAAAFLLLTPGIPAIYYGTEQSLGSAVPSVDGSDAALRETMFGGTFGAFGTSGQHVFDETSPSYVRIAALVEARRKYAPLRQGQLAFRDVRTTKHDFGTSFPGEIVAWSRVQNGQELLCVVNTDGQHASSAEVAVDAGLNSRAEPMTVVTNTMQAGRVGIRDYDGPLAGGARVVVTRLSDTRAFVSINDLGPSEVVILTNTPHLEDTELARVAREYRFSQYSYPYSASRRQTKK
jgi:glycosidase